MTSRKTEAISPTETGDREMSRRTAYRDSLMRWYVDFGFRSQQPGKDETSVYHGTGLYRAASTYLGEEFGGPRWGRRKV